jgi:Mn-dependent DtxR family transcriptional regulator
VVKAMALQESGEMYLETIYVLGKANTHVRSVDIAEHMGYSKPSVSRAVHLLQENGYIEMDEDGFIILTDSGKAVAEKIFERHTVISGMLIRLGVDPETAADDACKIEHAISDASFEAIKQHLQTMGMK